MNLQEFRKQYPMYNDIDDQTLAYKLWSRHYQDMDPKEFADKIDYKPVKGSIEAITEKPLEKVPFSPQSLLNTADVYTAAQRLQKNEYDKPGYGSIKRLFHTGMRALTIPGSGGMGGQLPYVSGEEQKRLDEEVIDKFRQGMFSQAVTKQGWISKGLGAASNIPAWGVELFLTGGLAGGAKTLAKKGIKKTLKKAVGKKAAKYAAGKAIQTTVAMPHRYVAGIMERRIPGMYTDENGQMQFVTTDNTWGEDIVKGWGDTYISVLSEGLGEGITKGIKHLGAPILKKSPFTQKLLTKLYGAWKKIHPKGSEASFLNKIFTKAGYNGLVGELGEERIETLLQGIAGTQDFGAGEDANIIQRLTAGIVGDVQNFPSELLALSTPGGAKFIGGHLLSKPAGYLTKEQREELKFETFQNQEGKVVYRSSKTPYDPTKIDKYGIFVTPFKSFADQIKGLKGRETGTETLSISSNAKILSFEDIPEELKTDDRGSSWHALTRQENLANYAREHGYDAYEYYDTTKNLNLPEGENLEIVVVNSSALKKEENVGRGKRIRELVPKISETIEKAENMRPERERLMSIEKGRRASELDPTIKKLREAGVDPVKAELEARRILSGEYEGADLPGIAEQFSPQEVNDMVAAVQDSNTLLPLEKTRLNEAIINLLQKERLPGRADIKLLSNFFGADLGKALRKHRTRGQKVWDEMIDIFNLPRALLASVDLSAIGRQGLFIGLAHPIRGAQAAWMSAKIFARPEYANTVMDHIEGSKNFLLSKRAKLDILQAIGAKYDTKDYDEQFASHLAEKLPLVKRSELAYVVGLNKLRFDIFSDRVNAWKAAGNKSMQDYKDLAAFLNHITGRGTIKGKTLEKYAPILNATFFSPRLLLSRFQLVGDFVQAVNPKSHQSMAVRKVIAGDLVKSVGTGLLVLGLLSLRKGIEVETDPRSSDFGKIKAGNTRLDYWAGYTQLARLVAQMISGQQKSTSTKRVYNIKRRESFTRFLQTKLSPPVGLAVDLYKGQTFLGDRLDLDSATVTEQAFQRLTPLFIQDVVDAIRYQGLESVSYMAPSAFFGIGAMTYPEKSSQTLTRLKDIKAREVFGTSWDNVSEIGQQMLRRAEPDIIELEAQAKEERENFDFLNKIAAEQAATGDRITKSLSKSVQEELDKINFGIAGLSRHVGQNWYLNDKNYQAYEKGVKNHLGIILNRIVNNRQYAGLPPAYKREILDKIVSKLKQAVRKDIINKANYQDMLKMSDLVG